MALSQTEQLIEEKIVQLFEGEGMESHFLVNWSLKGNKIEIFIDSDTGVTFDLCKQISRALESYFDESGILGEDYILEVSSAGVGKPLLLPRQFRKNIGRQIQVNLQSGEQVHGELAEADDEGFSVQWVAREKQGNKKVNVTHRRRIEYTESTKSIIKISV